MPKYKVIHPSLYMRVNGELQELKPGHEIELTQERGASMIKRKFVEAVEQAESEVLNEKPKKRTKKAKRKD